VIRDKKVNYILDSDEPIQVLEEDLFGFRHYVCALYHLIKYKLPEDASFTIGIFGDWGTGKTSLMKMLQNLLAREPEEFVTLYFDAWAFEDFDNLFPPLIIELSKLAGEDEDVQRLAREISEQILKVMVARATEGVVSWEEIKAQATKSVTGKAVIKAMEYRDKLWELVVRITEGRKKLIIFIDDLDRIVPPSRAVELLEDLQLLMDFPHVIYIIGVNRRALVDLLNITYSFAVASDIQRKAVKWGEKYLEKFFQLSILLPVLQGTTLKKLKNKSEQKKDERRKKLITKEAEKETTPLKMFAFSIVSLLKHYLFFIKYFPETVYLLLITSLVFFVDYILCIPGTYPCVEDLFKGFWGIFIQSLIVGFIGGFLFYPIYKILRFLAGRENLKKYYADKHILNKWNKKLQMVLRSGSENVKLLRLKILEIYKRLVAKAQNTFSKKDIGDKVCEIPGLSEVEKDEDFSQNILELLRNPRKFVRYRNLRLLYLFLIKLAERKAAQYGVFFDKNRKLSRWVVLISLWPALLENRLFKEIFEIDRFLLKIKREKRDEDLIFKIVRDKFKDLLKTAGVSVEEDINLLDRFVKFWIDTSIKAHFESLREVISYAYPIEYCHDSEEKLQFDDEVLALSDVVKSGLPVKTAFSSVLSYLKISNSELDNANFSEVVMDSNVNFEDTSLELCKFENVVCFRTAFKNSDLTKADFKNAILAGVSFENSVLREADFNQSFYIFADFSNVKHLEGAKNIDPCHIAIALRYLLADKRRKADKGSEDGDSKNDEKALEILKKIFERWWLKCFLKGGKQ